MAALVALLSLAGKASATEASAPSPESGANSLSPSLVAVLVSFAAFLLGSLHQRSVPTGARTAESTRFVASLGGDLLHHRGLFGAVVVQAGEEDGILAFVDGSREMASHIVGYPRMGPKRELKFALESFWHGMSSAEDLQQVAADLRASIWKQMSDAGIKYIPSNTFLYYD